MKQTFCTYRDTRDEILVSYLYDDIAAEERVRFEHHLSGCALCRGELEALGSVRTQLGRWSAPEPAAPPAGEAVPPVHRRAPLWTSMRQIPAWAQVAAAALVVGTAAGMANLDVSYTREGVSVRTGWMRPSGGADAVARQGRATSSDGQTAAASPWQSELVALEQQLRAEFGDQRASAQQAALHLAARANDEDVIRRLRTLIQESERRQQRELALRVAEVARDVQAQRQSDLVKIDRSLGIIQNRTGMEVMRQQQLLNNLLRVSQKQ
jgi:hypothetical protein